LGIRPFSSGTLAWPCSAACPSTVPGIPTKLPIHGEPNPILKAHRTQTMRTRQNVLNTIMTVFMIHLRWTRPP
jgi:hypothetical protein